MPSAIAERPPQTSELNLKALLDVPDIVRQSSQLVAQLDQCLLVGFGRLGSEQTSALDALARTVAGTPLETPVGTALTALRANEFQPMHFAALAAARAAIQGAQYDALRAQVDEALGRAPSRAAASPSPAAAARRTNVLTDSARHWLMELAITGFKQLDAAALAPFSSTLENLQADVSLARLSALLTGFQQELLGALPIGHNASLPVHRWADLWTRAMVSSLQADHPSVPATTKATGMLTVLGVDLRQHGTFVSAVVHALLEGDGDDAQRIVRVTMSSYKVDALSGREVWRSLAANGGSTPDPLLLLRAIAERVPLAVREMTLLETGDLLWDGDVREAGSPVDAFDIAARALASDSVIFPRVAPADRHPVQLSELVVLSEVRIDKDDLAVIAADGTRIAIAEARISAGSELTREDLIAAESMIGLLRFDGGRWMIQPLVVRSAPKGKKPGGVAFVGSSAYEVATKKPKKGEPNTLAVLKERAGRLLRKKA